MFCADGKIIVRLFAPRKTGDVYGGLGQKMTAFIVWWSILVQVESNGLVDACFDFRLFPLLRFPQNIP